MVAVSHICRVRRLGEKYLRLSIVTATGHAFGSQIIMYNAYFGFQEKPFTVTPDPRFCFPNPVYDEAYATLLYGIRERKGFILLSGEVGTGKTTLLRRLMNNLEASVRFVFFYNTNLTFEEIVSFTCEELGLSVKDGGRLQKIQALNEFLIEQLKKGGTGVLLIDEAQNLREEVLENLRLLSNLETASEKLIQIVLVGQPELETKLDQPNLRQIKQRIALRCRLDRLKEREVGPFICYRLRSVGYEHHDLFLPEAIQCVALYSKGIPRLINMICDNALLIAYGTSRKTVSAEIIEEVAHDLRLKEEKTLQAVAVEDTPLSTNSPLPPCKIEDIQFPTQEPVQVQEPTQAKVQRKPRRLSRVGVGTLLVLLFLGGGAFVMNPVQTRHRLSGLSLKANEFLGISGGGLESSKYNLIVWPAVPVPRVAEPEQVQSPPSSEPTAELGPTPPEEAKPALPAALYDRQSSSSALDSLLPTEVKKEMIDTKGEAPSMLSSPSSTLPAAGEWKDRPIVIQYGTTISEVVSQVYGGYNTLAIDLVNEFNPHIENLNWVKAGEKLWLPTLTRETLLRRDKNNRYRLILASPEKVGEARTLQETLRQGGYDAMIKPRRVSDDLTLYRVEVGGLKSVEAADQACRIAIARCWISFTEDARPGGRNE